MFVFRFSLGSGTLRNSSGVIFSTRRRLLDTTPNSNARCFVSFGFQRQPTLSVRLIPEAIVSREPYSRRNHRPLRTAGDKAWHLLYSDFLNFYPLASQPPASSNARSIRASVLLWFSNFNFSALFAFHLDEFCFSRCPSAEFLNSRAAGLVRLCLPRDSRRCLFHWDMKIVNLHELVGSSFFPGNCGLLVLHLARQISWFSSNRLLVCVRFYFG